MEATKVQTQQQRNLTLVDERLQLLSTIKEMVKIELERKMQELTAKLESKKTKPNIGV
ncbi:hypothetical protein [Capnocytophaga genosp. AHN8471]|uniref:hypothetical protein n=1 Tax=Capnocytophaga genosp. AHN8471 TaxID=327574 RepID=UPI00193239D8|nr:hypothetical protein [Capnocytophaga genosp. AHN8471]MBM0659181.1 hypothetical protein [Capnocytophaga genosp. AHN8471]